MHQEPSGVWIMAYTAIDDPSAHFQTVLYTGNGSANHAITNDGNSDLQPDLVWIKNRDAADSHCLFDSTRGATEVLHCDVTTAETTDADTLDSFASDGFQVDADVKVNTDTEAYVAWQWKANGGSTTNVDGTGTAADTTKAGTYQANTTAGFSIITFSTGVDDLGDHRIQHGLGAVPHFIITKERDGTYGWYTYHHKGTDDNEYIMLNVKDATSTAAARNVFDGSDFTSTYFEMGNNNIVNDSKTYVAYCWTEIQGYSKFGSYTGNANDDGPFVYTGFKPAWLMFKNSDASERWFISDNKRDTFNSVEKHMRAEYEGSEYSTTTSIDYLSNGFKIREDDNHMNGDGENIIYAAFAEQPFVTSGGVPCTAR